MSEIQIQQRGKPGLILSSDGGMTISIPIQIKRCSGRKRITLPDGEKLKPVTQAAPLTSLQSALARGYRWLKILESGEAASLKAIAKFEQVDDRYISRMVNLTTLAPDIVAAILDGNLRDCFTLSALEICPPILWIEQREKFRFNNLLAVNRA